MSPILGIWASSVAQTADTGAMFPLQVITVGAAGASSVSFTNIPNTYTHLQIRAIARGDASSSDDNLDARFNGDTGNNYAWHILFGTGSGVGASATTSTNYFMPGRMTYSSSLSSTFGVTVTDILDYANTNKYKTVRTLTGHDQNGSGIVLLNSGLWQSTSAVTSINLFPHAGGNFVQYSQFALYGIKGA